MQDRAQDGIVEEAPGSQQPAVGDQSSGSDDPPLPGRPCAGDVGLAEAASEGCGAIGCLSGVVELHEIPVGEAWAGESRNVAWSGGSGSQSSGCAWREDLSDAGAVAGAVDALLQRQDQDQGTSAAEWSRSPVRFLNIDTRPGNGSNR